jgi:hypothetical protein
MDQNSPSNGNSTRLNPARSISKYIALGIIALLLLSQMSPVIVSACGGIAGSFGVRLISHDCLGLRIEAKKAVEILPSGDLEFRFIGFHFRYFVSSDYTESSRLVCIGQDIWYGE